MCRWPESVPTARVVPCVKRQHMRTSWVPWDQTFCTHATELMVSLDTLKSHNLETAAL